MDDLSQRHTAYRDRSRALSLDMVRRSEARLSNWVAQLPPKDGAFDRALLRKRSMGKD